MRELVPPVGDPVPGARRLDTDDRRRTDDERDRHEGYRKQEPWTPVTREAGLEGHPGEACDDESGERQPYEDRGALDLRVELAAATGDVENRKGNSRGRQEDEREGNGQAQPVACHGEPDRDRDGCRDEPAAALPSSASWTAGRRLRAPAAECTGGWRGTTRGSRQMKKPSIQNAAVLFT